MLHSEHINMHRNHFVWCLSIYPSLYCTVVTLPKWYLNVHLYRKIVQTIHSFNEHSDYAPRIENMQGIKWLSAVWVSFYAPKSNDRGHIVFVLSVCLSFCLFVCLSVVNFNLYYNFWNVRDRHFIFGMHTPLMWPFQMTPRSMTLWPWLWPWS